MRTITITVTGVLLTLAALAGCKPAATSSTGSFTGWPVVAVADGPGQWERAGGSAHNPAWAFVAAGAAAGALAAAAAAGGEARPSSRGYGRAVMSFVGNPCKNRPDNYKLVSYTTRLPKGLSFGEAKNPSPWLDCRSLRNILTHRTVPARLQNMYDCIRLILRDGSPVYSAVRKAVVWSWWDGVVVVGRNGRILTSAPAKGNWERCAKAAGS